MPMSIWNCKGFEGSKNLWACGKVLELYHVDLTGNSGEFLLHLSNHLTSLNPQQRLSLIDTHGLPSPLVAEVLTRLRSQLHQRLHSASTPHLSTPPQSQLSAAQVLCLSEDDGHFAISC
ncbi:hypothetical protein Moror_11193 [Moniliophthora roreri MCA 2997]|uniref:Uncharacterized protein n=1 Tax=Moniliophthora roreri (strain MCA 2997) TaxID=1381753 RepID=V2WQ72_MONRO|nr:hypothetical protein Moror_11193 [Moniliophthora roreri MCA 2997]